MSFITDSIGSLFGAKSHDQRVSDKLNDQSQLQSAEAGGYRNNAATGYKDLGTQGANNTNLFASNAPGLIASYKGLNGINPDNSLGNPYALTQDQMTQLNGHVDDLTKRQDNAIQQLRASLAAKGINDPRYIANAEANIKQGFGGLIEQHRANFGEQVRQEKQTALQNLMQYLQGINQTGTGQQEASAGGFGNLAGGAQSASVSSQNQSAQAQERANQGISDLLGLASFGLGGGFNKKGATGGSGSGAADNLNYGNWLGQNGFTDADLFTSPAPTTAPTSNPFSAYSGNSLTDYPSYGTTPSLWGY